MPDMIKTKIYGTIGPSSYQKEMIKNMINIGLSGLRINLSHGSFTGFQKWFSNIKEACMECGKSIDIIADIKGPEIRAELISKAYLNLNENDSVFIYSANPPHPDTDNNILFNPAHIVKLIKKGQTILLDDGLIRLSVNKTHKYGNEIKVECTVLQGGRLGNKKGVNLPGMKNHLPSLGCRDKEDIAMGIREGINYIMLPFTRTMSDVQSLRNYLDSKGGENIGILAKIENQEGIDNLESFLDKIEGIVIARGDLGVEIGITKVPIVQKEIIKLCNQKDKISIVVTDMLHSMINSPVPTRAEISDIANAVLDGCSGLMLTDETAAGKYPLESIRILIDTAAELEKWMLLKKGL
jgi:pyruvate kinase